MIPAHDAATALRQFEEAQPDIAVLDVDYGHPSRGNGFDLLRELRGRPRRREVAVIMLTGMAAERDKLKGFELGADDYLTKPFSHHELLARIRALLKRSGRAAAAADVPPAALAIGPLAISVDEHAATKAGQSLNLTVTEFRVLHYLMARANAVVPTRELMKHVWGYDDPSGNEAVRVAVHRLRRKVEDDPARPRLLHTVPGVGVMLKFRPAA